MEIEDFYDEDAERDLEDFYDADAERDLEDFYDADAERDLEEAEEEVEDHPLLYAVAGWRIALDIIEKYQDKTAKYQSPFTGAEHDVLYLDLSVGDVPVNSEDGKMLRSLGFTLDKYGEGWLRYV